MLANLNHAVWRRGFSGVLAAKSLLIALILISVVSLKTSGQNSEEKSDGPEGEIIFAPANGPVEKLKLSEGRLENRDGEKVRVFVDEDGNEESVFPEDQSIEAQIARHRKQEPVILKQRRDMNDRIEQLLKEGNIDAAAAMRRRLEMFNINVQFDSLHFHRHIQQTRQYEQVQALRKEIEGLREELKATKALIQK